MAQVEKLITVSQNKVLEPEEMFDWDATTKGAPISLWGVTLATTKEYGDLILPRTPCFWQLKYKLRT